MKLNSRMNHSEIEKKLKSFYEKIHANNLPAVIWKLLFAIEYCANACGSKNG